MLAQLKTEPAKRLAAGLRMAQLIRAMSLVGAAAMLAAFFVIILASPSLGPGYRNFELSMSVFMGFLSFLLAFLYLNAIAGSWKVVQRCLSLLDSFFRVTGNAYLVKHSPFQLGQNGGSTILLTSTQNGRPVVSVHLAPQRGFAVWTYNGPSEATFVRVFCRTNRTSGVVFLRPSMPPPVLELDDNLMIVLLPDLVGDYVITSRVHVPGFVNGGVVNAILTDANLQGLTGTKLAAMVDEVMRLDSQPVAPAPQTGRESESSHPKPAFIILSVCDFCGMIFRIGNNWLHADPNQAATAYCAACGNPVSHYLVMRVGN